MDDAVMVFAGAFLVIYLIILMFSLVIGIVRIIAMYRLYEKAGVEGWKCLIPFYNYFEQVRITFGNYNIAIIYIALTIAYLIFNVTGNLTGQWGLSIVSMLFYLGLAVVACYVNYNFGKAYGKSTGWNVAMIFFSGILVIVMGFDNSTVYTGPLAENKNFMDFGNGYGNRNYGGPDYGNQNYGGPNYGNQNYGGSNYGNQNYGGPDYGNQNYGGPNYGNQSYGGPSYGNQNYGGPDYGNQSYGGPDYENQNYGSQNPYSQNPGNQNSENHSSDNQNFSDRKL